MKRRNIAARAAFRIAAAAIPLAAAQPAAAWDGAVTFKIVALDATDGNNFGFRVWGGLAMCGEGTPTWAYMNPAWDNYQATAALLTSAWLAGKQVTMYSTKDANGYCRFSYVSVR